MIKTIEIGNFQSHSGTVLELSNGVNIIKGRSHSGKSSIVRALKWCLLNQPRGDYFVSFFKNKKDSTMVGVGFSEDTYLIRERGSNTNCYQFGYDEENSTIDPGADLPEEVTNISNISSINFQTQDEQHFLFKESPGKVARELNKIVGLDIIDRSISNLNKIENENKITVKNAEKEKGEIEEKLRELDFVFDLEKRVEKIEELTKKFEEVSSKRNFIIETVKQIKELKDSIKADTEWLSIKEPVQKLKILMEKRSSELNSLNKLRALISDIKKFEIVKGRANGEVGQLLLKRSQIVNSAEYKKEFCPKCGAHIKYWRKK